MSSDEKNNNKKKKKQSNLFDADDTTHSLGQSGEKKEAIFSAKMKSKMKVDAITMEKLKTETKKNHRGKSYWSTNCAGIGWQHFHFIDEKETTLRGWNSQVSYRWQFTTSTLAGSGRIRWSWTLTENF